MGILVAGCKGGASQDPMFVGKSEVEVALIKRGQAVYLSQCAACHNSDPRRVGVLGPAVQDSSLELLKMRVLYAKYPEGYKPKMSATGQPSSQMPAMPHLEADIPAIYAYFQALAAKAP